jgi:uncharacterized protein YegL
MVDVSYSMAGAKLDAANQICPEVATAAASSPIMRDKTRFGVMTFSNDAQVVLPISDLGSVTQLPVFREEGGTSFRAAFDLLRKTIDSDVATLKADGFKLHRPAVFFVTDGEPTDETADWQSSFAQLTDADQFRYWPNVIGFGVEGAVAENIRYISHPSNRFPGFMQADGATAPETIKKISEVILTSILSSAASVGQGADPTAAMTSAIQDAVSDASDVLEPAGDWIC